MIHIVDSSIPMFWQCGWIRDSDQIDEESGIMAKGIASVIWVYDFLSTAELTLED